MLQDCLCQSIIAFPSRTAGTALAGILAVLLAGGLDMKATLAVRGRCGSSFLMEMMLLVSLVSKCSVCTCQPGSLLPAALKSCPSPA